ncbi:MAG TPA: GNAT family N-acetyltransferase [Acidimicrobiales bacterium]|nr:GNAT family N-acetyltransferase [Acidimicrobiales bacterium]
MSDELRFDIVDPLDAGAIAAVEAYFAELNTRFPGGFDGEGAIEADAAGLRPPGGAFVLARLGDQIAGCGGVHSFEPAIGEIKRMWVDPRHRGRGVGVAVLDELERLSSALGHRVVRLDTNENLPEALAMYRSRGYVEIERYNDNPYPTHFFEKALVGVFRS